MHYVLSHDPASKCVLVANWMTVRVSLSRFGLAAGAFLLSSGFARAESEVGPTKQLQLELRQRVITSNGEVKITFATETFDARKMAVVVIDMWDRHWCKTYTARVAELVPRMNATLAAARKLGLQIVWAPSDVLDFYTNHPRRKAM